PCLNDAACQTVPSGFYMCHCKLPYSGKHCQTSKEWCLNDTNPCVNGGECVKTAQNYSCLCPENTYGLNCEMERQCERLQPCQNGGMCRDSASGYVCKCAGSYAGESCQYIDYCLSNPCLNAGACLSLDKDFFCQCPKPFRGKNCQIKGKYAFNIPCKNDGECQSFEETFYCTCEP
ncbi:hypothetical protein HELRODRAFT_124998, partial [Helobdella robusta]|uniref:EGF-like domain-containing protein n=1 Tax=Helobdella robusta TaxID=6412 RepID=T1EH40_HELRO